MGRTRERSRLADLQNYLYRLVTVGNLYGLWRGLGSRFGIQTGAITADDLDLGVCHQPCCRAICASIRQQVDHFASFEIAEDRSVTVAFSPRPVIDSNHP
jgi:hypothetical protein